jgi:hypothetical protein
MIYKRLAVLCFALASLFSCPPNPFTHCVAAGAVRGRHTPIFPVYARHSYLCGRTSYMPRHTGTQPPNLPMCPLLFLPERQRTAWSCTHFIRAPAASGTHICTAVADARTPISSQCDALLTLTMPTHAHTKHCCPNIDAGWHCA